MGCCCASPCIGELEVASGIEQLLGQRKEDIRKSIEANSEAIGVMTRAFGGTATTAPEGTTDYMLGPSLREKWDDPRRVAMVEWMAKVDWACCMARNGFALGMRKSDGKLGAVVVVLPYNEGIPNDFSSGLEILKALRATGMPPSKQLGEDYKGMKARAWAAQSIIENVKKRHCHRPHAHVRNMSVDPDAQGLGFCGKLMRAVNKWADDSQLNLWLETSGARNVAIYERFGYKTMEQFTLKCKNDPEVHDEEFGMMRLARTPTE
eukprot:symbB.v1.2.023476.t1/scaffold2076.1/size90297/2